MDFRNTPQFFSLLFSTSNNRDIYTRKYAKIQDILANMGGLIKGLMLCVQLVFMLFNKTNYYFFLIQTLYSSEGAQESRAKDGLGRSIIQLPDLSQSKIIGNLNNNFVGNMKNNNSTQFEDNLMVRIKELAMERKKKKVTACKMISIPFLKCLGTKSKTVSIYQQARGKIDGITDIIKLYNVAEELDLMKNILFTDEARTLIDFLMNNKVLTQPSSNVAKVSLDEVYNIYKDLALNELNNSLRNVFELRLNAMTNKAENMLIE
jgi:hypothetical protein